VTFTAAGSCTIDANQPGDSTFAAAPQVQQTFTVASAITGPTVTNVFPNVGPTFGFSLVIISGKNLGPNGFFPRGVKVHFGARAATVLFDAGTWLGVLTPPGNGEVQVTVRVNGKTSPITEADEYHYVRFMQHFPF
jgi:hypothetical protein